MHCAYRKWKSGHVLIIREMGLIMREYGMCIMKPAIYWSATNTLRYNVYAYTGLVFGIARCTCPDCRGVAILVLILHKVGTRLVYT